MSRGTSKQLNKACVLLKNLVAKARIGLPQIPTGQNGRGELCSWPQLPAGTEDS